MNKVLSMLFKAWKVKNKAVFNTSDGWEDELMLKIMTNEKMLFLNSLFPQLSMACSILAMAFGISQLQPYYDWFSELQSFIADDYFTYKFSGV